VGNYEKISPHPWGLCDMHGNVAQWCQNFYNNQEDSRVLRGGSWQSGAKVCRSAERYPFKPNLGHLNVGFRVAFVP
jgi:formylglycine-generating enzyme required for sulfatase activity